MKIAKKLTIVSSLLLVAGCAHQERQARYNESNTSTTYGASSTTSSGISGTASATAQPSTSFEGTATSSATSQTDQTLVTQVQQAFRNDSALAAIAPSIQVTAQNGAVTLSGKVSSEQEKQKAETMAKSASGVVSVNNQLQVSLQPTSERPGQSSRIYQEPATTTQPGATATEPARTDTSTPETSKRETPKSETSVTSQFNTQPSATENKELAPTSQAGASSRIYSTSQPSTIGTFGQTSDSFSVNVQGLTETDRSLGQKVMQELRTDATLAAQLSAIKISVDNGKITLRGNVKSDDQKKSIESAVQRVTGVSSVDNQLQVSATSSTTTEPEPNK